MSPYLPFHLVQQMYAVRLWFRKTFAKCLLIKLDFAQSKIESNQVTIRRFSIILNLDHHIQVDASGDAGDAATTHLPLYDTLNHGTEFHHQHRDLASVLTFWTVRSGLHISTVSTLAVEGERGEYTWSVLSTI